MRQEQITDEFGRDPSLRKSKAHIEYDIALQPLRQRFKGKSWAEVHWEIEEEKEKETQNRAKKMDEERRNRWLFNAYEIEEGEIFA
jgi:hypothetical protein